MYPVVVILLLLLTGPTSSVERNTCAMKPTIEALIGHQPRPGDGSAWTSGDL